MEIQREEMEQAYAYWLHAAMERDNKGIENLLREKGTAEKIYHMTEKELTLLLDEKRKARMMETKRNWSIREAYERLRASGVVFYTKNHPDFPVKLREIPDCPYAIYVKGKLPEARKGTVAVVGARNCSAYGSYVARECGKALGRAGIQVISGMARGIDGISQKGALDAGGTTYAVLGSGVDVCYPESNRALYEEIQERGGIISEYRPGMYPAARNFPPRNRIISGLSDIVLVIEAKEKSGTLITVDMALEQGREVFVLPGRITDSLSFGCNRLIKQGANIMLSIEELIHEIFQLMNPYILEETEKLTAVKQLNLCDLLMEQIENPLGKIVIQCMDFTPQPFEQIYEKVKKESKKTGMMDNISSAIIMQQLVELQIRGMIQQIGGQYNLCVK